MLLLSLLRIVTASICLGPAMAQKVTQARPVISMSEKEAVTLDCVYEISGTTYYLFWYKQPPSGEMIFLIRQESYSEQNATEGRYSLNFQKSDRSISLTITSLQLRDSALYFCALRDTTVMRHLWEPLRNLRSQASPSYEHQTERRCAGKKWGLCLRRWGFRGGCFTLRKMLFLWLREHVKQCHSSKASLPSTLLPCSR
uniref:Ig-like domain-containing protein n=1 Tax=Suricata suricatta TaxID=37032 RepID=A0A673TI70_SURSU